MFFPHHSPIKKRGASPAAKQITTHLLTTHHSPLTSIPYPLSPIPYPLLLFRAGGYEIGAFRGIKKRFFSGHGRRNRWACSVSAAAKWPEKGRLFDAENAFSGILASKRLRGGARRCAAAPCGESPRSALLGF